METGRAALNRIAKSLRQLSRVPSQAASGAAPEIRKLLVQQFLTGTDPYGGRWASLSQATLDKGRSPPPLTDSGAMATLDVQPSQGAGITITLGADYSRFHQTGTRYMPARPILPDQRGLPATWRRAIQDAADRSFERIMGGR